MTGGKDKVLIGSWSSECGHWKVKRSEGGETQTVKRSATNPYNYEKSAVGDKVEEASMKNIIDACCCGGGDLKTW